ncbi:MAG: ABC transporter ATP-binding protein [Saprospiraceae bacterium]|nr:ABC transporter ATP-binding protein [Saprospiraceae bacterium]MBK7358128.1 ABC transporter ATP-binding protein [Saprospiraceae bacterium]MBK7738424.1 ABC transporter ATP-binding protein [Saprospiraceae bacterium]MBK7913007.1 ABC transporter ATP-binding protein [Saprospiraceae bacterium]
MIRISGLEKRFKKLVALNDIHVQFNKGQVISLIGPNGSGKTTLIKCILGLVRPDRGQIELDGASIFKDESYRKKIGYMPQIGRYPDQMKVGQLFSLLKSIRSSVNLDEEMLELYKLHDIWEKPMRSLSGGTRQKVSAAVAFLFDPEILILDEPTAGLDPLSSELLKEKIQREKAKGKLILITSHILSDLDDLTTHVLYLQEGTIQFNGNLNELKQQTGEEKFGKAIARFMKIKNEATHVEIV